MQYGNGAVSNYEYDDETGQLVKLNTVLDGKVLQNIDYKSITSIGVLLVNSWSIGGWW